MSDPDREAENGWRWPFTTAIALLCPVLYVLSTGPVVAISSWTWRDWSLVKIGGRAKVLAKLYLPLIHAAEGVMAEPIIYRYVGLFGRDHANEFRSLRAAELLDIATRELDAGNIEVARKLACRAEHLDAEYDILDLAPEYVMCLIERAERDSASVSSR